MFLFLSSNPFTWIIGAGILGTTATHVDIAKGDLYVTPAKNNTSEVTYANYLFKNKTWYSKNTFPQIKNGSMDLLPAGNRAFFREVKETSKDEWYTSTDVNVFVNSSGFIPTASSLALGKGKNPNPNRYWDDDLRGVNLSCNYAKETPFDYYFGPGYYNGLNPDVNLKHDSLFEAQANIVLEEINGIVHDNIQHFYGRIEYTQGWWCPNTTKVFTVYPNLPMTWSTSNPNFAIVSGQNSSQLVLQYNGNLPVASCEVYASFNDGCYSYEASTSVLSELLVIPSYIKGTFSQGVGHNSLTNDLTLNSLNNVGAVSTDVKFWAPQLDNSTLTFNLTSSTGTLYGWQTAVEPRTGVKYLQVAAAQECDRTKYHTFSVTYKKNCPNSPTFTEQFSLAFCTPNGRLNVLPDTVKKITSNKLLNMSSLKYWKDNEYVYIKTKESITENKLTTSSIIGNKNYNFQWYDMAGRLVSLEGVKVDNGIYKIKIPKVPNGIYIIKVSSLNYSESIKIIL